MTSLWFALAVHSRSEAAAAADLQTRVDEVFLPARIERRAWSDRVKSSEVPLFPGYLFVRTNLTAGRRVELLRAKHVVEVVGRLPNDTRIARAIPASEVESLRVVVNAERAIDPVERLTRGRHILVATGPLRGVRGIVEQGADGQRRLLVQIALLGRGVRTLLSADDVVEAIEVAA